MELLQKIRNSRFHGKDLDSVDHKRSDIPRVQVLCMRWNQY